VADPLESVLRLVAEGRLTAAEAGPILDALDDRDAADARPSHASGSAAPPAGGPGKALRIEITEHGRKVVNLRVPLSLGRAALSRIPGLAEATTERIREALDAGISGPIMTVDDDGDGVRVIIE
jgi:hypothetical protein